MRRIQVLPEWKVKHLETRSERRTVTKPSDFWEMVTGLIRRMVINFTTGGLQCSRGNVWRTTTVVGLFAVCCCVWNYLDGSVFKFRQTIRRKTREQILTINQSKRLPILTRGGARGVGVGGNRSRPPQPCAHGVNFGVLGPLETERFHSREHQHTEHSSDYSVAPQLNRVARQTQNCNLMMHDSCVWVCVDFCLPTQTV